MRPVICPKCGRNLAHTRALSGSSGLVSGSSCIHCGTWIDDDIEEVMPAIPEPTEEEIAEDMRRENYTGAKRGRPRKEHDMPDNNYMIDLLAAFQAKQRKDLEKFKAELDSMSDSYERLQFAVQCTNGAML